MSTAHATKPTGAPHGVQLGYNLLTIIIVAAGIGLGLAYGIDALARDKSHGLATSDEQTLTRTMGDKNLEIPASWFRYGEQKVEGFANQVDLSLELPLGKDGAPARIEVTLLPQSRARPSASLLDGVYLHQFSTEQLSGPTGLVGKPLRGMDGFEDETVWYDPLSAAPFAAKCIAPLKAGEPDRCLRTVLLVKGMAAVYAFDAEVLGNWQKFDAEMAPRLKRIGIL